MSVIVHLSDAEICEASANSTWRYRQMPGTGTYGSNRNDRHLTGSLGEVAVFAWLDKRYVRVLAGYRLGSGRADLIADSLGVEVKSWRAHHWEPYGLLIAVRQLTKIASTSNVVLACRVPSEPEKPRDIELMGWVPVAEFATHSRGLFVASTPEVRIDVDRLRPMSDLRNWTSPRESSPALHRSESACGDGHQRLFGHCWDCAAPQHLKQVIVSSEGNLGRKQVFHVGEWDRLPSMHGNGTFRAGWKRVAISEAVAGYRPCPTCFALDRETLDLPADWGD